MKAVLIMMMMLIISGVSYAQSGLCQVMSVDGKTTSGLCPKPTAPVTYPQAMPATTAVGVAGTLPQGTGKPRWCGKQGQGLSEIELLICADPTLSAYDVQMNAIVMQLPSPRPKLAPDRDSKVANVADKRTALLQWYQSAIQLLQNRAAGGTGGAQAQMSYSPLTSQPTTGGIDWCGKLNLTAAERALCSLANQIPGLSQLEFDLNQAYSAASKKMRKTQRGWLKERDSKVMTGNAQDIIPFYQARISALRGAGR